jgi:hypothetical protein
VSVKAKFAERFGEAAADAVVTAAEYHDNGINSQRGKGSDPFKWALLIAISYECCEKDSYREWHHTDFAPWAEIRQWIIDNADLATHDGDFDYLAMFAGAYDEFMPKKAEAL